MIKVSIATTGAMTIELDSASAVKLARTLGETWSGEGGLDELYDAMAAAMETYSA